MAQALDFQFGQTRKLDCLVHNPARPNQLQYPWRAIFGPPGKKDEDLDLLHLPG